MLRQDQETLNRIDDLQTELQKLRELSDRIAAENKKNGEGVEVRMHSRELLNAVGHRECICMQPAACLHWLYHMHVVLTVTALCKCKCD